MEVKLFELIEVCKEYIAMDAYYEVMHFYNHGEYEMALEGLLIEMIKTKSYPEKIAKESITDLAKHYRLDCESVFEYDFWNKYLEWISSN